MLKLLYIFGALILSCLVILYYKSKTILDENKEISKRNIKFVNERIQYIEDYFEYDLHLKLITNRHKDKIVGFFFEVRKESSQYEVIKYRKCPTISHELSIDEFCYFIEEYIKPSRDKNNMVQELMVKHRELLEWE